MRRTVGILTIVAVVSLLGASDVQAGAALIPAGKTTGPGLTATIVIDVTQGGPAKGQSTIRVQKASTSVAVMFDSNYISNINFIAGTCINIQFNDLKRSTAFWFTGLIDGFVDDPNVLNSFLGQFGTPSKAAITSQDYIACTPEVFTTAYDSNGQPIATEIRQILSFTAVIQFQP